MPLPRAAAWTLDRSLRPQVRDLIMRLGFSNGVVETAMFRYEKGYTPRDEFENDIFRVFELMTRIHNRDMAAHQAEEVKPDGQSHNS